MSTDARARARRLLGISEPEREQDLSPRISKSSDLRAQLGIGKKLSSEPFTSPIGPQPGFPILSRESLKRVIPGNPLKALGRAATVGTLSIPRKILEGQQLPSPEEKTPRIRTTIWETG